MRKIKRKLRIVIVAIMVLGALNYEKLGDLDWSKKTDVTADNLFNAAQMQLSEWIPETKLAETESQTKISLKNPDSNNITVGFIDVGQGDCIIIRDNGEVMMIDTGVYDAYDNVETVLTEQGIIEIDTLVLTHPDADHIQSAPEIITEYGVDTIYMSAAESDSKTYENLLETISMTGVEVIYPSAGDLLEFGTASYEVVGPVVNEPGYYSDTNSCSLVIRMVNGNDSFLFAGDATGEEVEDILLSGMDVSADIYKVAHHGSANDGCNNYDFWNAIDPETVIISCAYQNPYGHPHIETMEKVQEYNCSLYRTDLQSTIFGTSTGNGIVWSQTPCRVYTNGNGF